MDVCVPISRFHIGRFYKLAVEITIGVPQNGRLLAPPLGSLRRYSSEPLPLKNVAQAQDWTWSSPLSFP